MGSAEKILSEAEVISLENCYCRETLKNCNNPLDVCLGINETAQAEIENNRARRISLQDALQTLEKSHKAGLVHLAYNERGKGCGFICSCCSCCCHHLIALKQFGYHDAVVKSLFRATFDPSLCANCGICISRCQFGAWSWGENRVEHDAKACFGCGLCVSTCPSGAISLIPRQ
jgi:NAD-dependent dihydropyrimidine dehydrogenase PreA subunit